MPVQGGLSALGQGKWVYAMYRREVKGIDLYFNKISLAIEYKSNHL